IQEDYVTIRDDRYVISIKSGVHARVDGIIHGRSNSGATYFVEPFQLVELNNRIAILRKEEKAEEIEILKEITRMVLSARGGLLRDQGIIAELDCVQAKALFAKDVNATMPDVRNGGDVFLKGARHPLLILKEIRGGERVTPIDITIKEGCGTLVISGANTGGKTVALKTLGLLTLMVLSGIPVPVEEASTAVAFASVFADIGDRQDIIASLSTFSAHIKRIKEFLSLAGAGSLVLIDEIGAGTDPAEGGAFALAALDTFMEKGATTVVTTHLNLLKAHAQADPGYMNASVEFDESTLRPLYRLHYGVPGPSLGLSIARSLGIPSGIIDAARENLKESEGAFIESVRLL
ncbi:MAG: endonuclease MutS2, partial [Deltaproteobacteria bacterium]